MRSGLTSKPKTEIRSHLRSGSYRYRCGWRRAVSVRIEPRTKGARSEDARPLPAPESRSHRTPSSHRSKRVRFATARRSSAEFHVSDAELLPMRPVKRVARVSWSVRAAALAERGPGARLASTCGTLVSGPFAVAAWNCATARPADSRATPLTVNRWPRATSRMGSVPGRASNAHTERPRRDRPSRPRIAPADRARRPSTQTGHADRARRPGTRRARRSGRRFEHT